MFTQNNLIIVTSRCSPRITGVFQVCRTCVILMNTLHVTLGTFHYALTKKNSH
jgi:hypothetical protein